MNLMSIRWPEQFGYNSPYREACTFITSGGFSAFAEVAASVFKGNLAASFLRETQRDDFIISWIHGFPGSGFGISLVESENIHTVDGMIVNRPNSFFPELKLQDEKGKPLKAVPQLLINTGHMTLDGYSMPADVAVDQSSRIITATYQLVKLKWGQVDPENKVSVALKAHRDGGFSVFERGKYSREASERLYKALAGSSLYNDLAIVS